MPSEPSAEEREATVNRLREQLANCQTIAASKTGSDRDGWLEDAKHYETALRIIQSAERDTANRYEARIAELEAIAKNIADQKTTAEMIEEHGDEEGASGDFEYAYDKMIEIARTAFAPALPLTKDKP